MMSSENIPPVTDTSNNNSPIARKSTVPKTQEQPSLKCPRCDSSNTKFCYYNNYSLTQPRHFCKTCRRYWTKGGALRNVPIGGGCRKTKKHKPSSSFPNSSTSSRFDLSAGPGNFLAPPTVTPAMEFQLGGLSLPRLHPATAGVYTQFIASSGSHHQPIGIGMGSGTAGCFSLDLLGLSNNYPTIPSSGNSSSSSSSSLSLAGSGATATATATATAAGMGAGDHTISISSIESLSSINQEMHWKLQQQRLALIYGPTSVEDDHQEKNHLGGGEMSLFKNLESTTKLDVAGPTPTEWLFEQIQSNQHSSANYGNNGATENNNTTNCNNHHQDFNGIWTTELHHHQQQQQHHQFNGLQ